MLRAEAQELQAELGDTVEWKVKHGEFKTVAGALSFAYTGTYTYRTKQPKLVKWSDVPVGVSLKHKQTYEILTFRASGKEHLNLGLLRAEKIQSNGDSCSSNYRTSSIELAPADQQPWIARQDDYDGEKTAEGLIYKWRDNGSYKITSLQDGYVMEGAV
jgi:hypothetical protein